MIDPKPDQVIQVGAAECVARRRAPGHAQRLKPVFERLDDLPGGVLAAAHRDDAVVARGTTFDVGNEPPESRFASDPVDLALLLDGGAIAITDIIETDVRTRLRQD